MATRDPLVKRPKVKKQKRGRRSTVMEDPKSIEAVCLAELGKNNDCCREKYGLSFSDGQFQYRLSKAKQAAGMKKGDGFRKAWRDGRSPYEEMLPAILPELRRNYREQILPVFEHALPQISNIKELTVAPSVDETVAALKKKKAGFG